MAWISLLSMIVFTLLVFMPIFPDSRIKALADLFGLFYIGMAGVVGAYMGMTAYTVSYTHLTLPTKRIV